MVYALLRLQLVSKIQVDNLCKSMKYFSTESHVNSIRADKKSLTNLRKKTGYSFVKCNEALKLYNNNLQEAESWLHEQAEKEGWSKAQKLKERSTSQGLVGILVKDNYAALVELACETDFVARNELFQELVSTTAQATLNFRQQVILQNQKINSFHNNDITHLREFLLQHELQNLKVTNENTTLQDYAAGIVGKIGENIKLKRALAIATSNANIIGSAAHGNTSKLINNCLMGSYVAAVVLKPLNKSFDRTAAATLAKGLSQHVIGLNPQALNPGTNIDEEDALLTQDFLLNDKIKVNELVQKANVEVIDFVRYGVDE